MFKFKPGDLVTCKLSEEITQPMTVVGPNPWYDSFGPVRVYHVKGKHRKGKEVTISLEETVLQEYKSDVD